MTLYTSDTKRTGVRTQKTALIYLAVAVFCAVFGAVYEVFSHGVISAFMVLAFLFPLLGGALPFFLIYKAGSARQACRRKAAKKRPAGARHASGNRPPLSSGIVARSLYHSGIISLTVGSIMTGILEIYGTTNGLTAAYWLAGAALMLSGIVTHLITVILRPNKV